MEYGDFILPEVQAQFGLTLTGDRDLFSNIPPLPPSDLLAQLLADQLAIATAVSTEKARSELLIAPILMDLRRQRPQRLSLFSGTEFNVDPDQGLAGFCDFLLSASPEQFFIQAPVVAIVEAKNENITSGLGQCIAELIAAQQFNAQPNRLMQTLYRAVTTGTNWRFVTLESKHAHIDRVEYFIKEIDKILGILAHPFQPPELADGR
ncbi:MAG: hypothetical protein AAGA67_12815 [Cyanobacteria bacterium P01_F01_bin.153]